MSITLEQSLCDHSYNKDYFCTKCQYINLKLKRENGMNFDFKKNLKNLKTRDECQKIVKTSNTFYCTETVIEGFKVEMYDYRLASYSDFKEHDALELRGLTFVYNPDTEIWERHLALAKFFNCNQTEDYMYNDLIKEEILSVQDKRDGSMITFITLPNGNTVAKTKMSFISPQAVMAQTIYDNNTELKNFINHCNTNKCTPIFEITSPRNQIVLQYHNTELYLLQLRANDSGIYTKDLEVATEIFNIKVVKKMPIEYQDLDYLLSRKKIDQMIEGWVVTTKNGHYKIKTDWYLQMHGLVTEGSRENLLIKTILDKNIDDVLAQIPDGEKKDFIINVEKIVNKKFSDMIINFKELRRKYFQDFNENRKEFSIKYSKEEMFGPVMKTLNTSFRDVEQAAELAVTKHLLRITKDLNKAISWLNDNK